MKKLQQHLGKKETLSFLLFLFNSKIKLYTFKGTSPNQRFIQKLQEQILCFSPVLFFSFDLIKTIL